MPAWHEKKCVPLAMRTQPPEALLLDMDGVLYHGTRALPHARDFLAAVAQVPHIFLTNNPIATPQQVVEKLHSMGFCDVDQSRVLTSGMATAGWLYSECPGFRYYAIGAEGLHAELSRFGKADGENADFVVVGEGVGLDYASLTKGINLILKKGARLVSTNPDTTVDAFIDGAHRVLPGGGALVSPFETACGCKAVTIGKPEPLLYQMAMSRLGLSAPQCLMVGDRPDTDIAGAQRLSMETALVRTGRFAPAEPWPEYQPQADWDVPDLRHLLQAWREVWPEWI